MLGILRQLLCFVCRVCKTRRLQQTSKQGQSRLNGTRRVGKYPCIQLQWIHFQVAWLTKRYCIRGCVTKAGEIDICGALLAVKDACHRVIHTLIYLKQKYLGITLFSLELISWWNDQKENQKLPFCSARWCDNDPTLTCQCRCHLAYCDPRIARLIAPVARQFRTGASGSSHPNPILDLKMDI